MEKTIKVGDVVSHKKHGFKGIVEEIQNEHSVFGADIIIRITEGEHPYSNVKSTYSAIPESLEIETKDSFEEMIETALKELGAIKDEVKDSIKIGTDGYVDVKLPDGIELGFEYYTDFKDFMKVMNTIK